MSTEKLMQLKRYLCYVSIIFACSSFVHLLYSYLYHDSQLIPIKGGNISEGIIGNYPSLNPLTGEGGNNQYLIHLLYRSVLQYKSESGQISDDLASCDISNLLRIECYLENGIKWSDGSDITADDIVMTYKLLQSSNINPLMASLLANTEIKQTDASIVFTNPSKDVNFLNIFFQPIIPASTINSLSHSELAAPFSVHNSLYSGKFKIGSIHNDSSLGITKFFLEKNSHYNGADFFIDRLILRLFPSVHELLKNKESIHIIGDQNRAIGDAIPRLEQHPYTLNQYVGVFLNKDNIISSDIRTFLLNTIKRDNLITILGGEEYFRPVQNPYLSDTSLDSELENKNIDGIMKSLGYQRKTDILANFLEKNTENYSDEATLSGSLDREETESSESTEAETREWSLQDFQADAKTIFAPDYIERYNYVTQSDILLQGNVDTNTQAVYINDYKLQKFNPGDSQFNYRATSNMQLGVNNFDIFFEQDGEKIFQETITIVYHPNKTELDKTLSTLVAKLGAEREQQEQAARIAAAEAAAEIPAVQESGPDPRAEALAAIEALDDETFYDENGVPLTLELYYTDTSDYLIQTAEYIQTSLKEVGIESTLTPIALSNLPQVLRDKSQYDILLTGIHTGYFDFNIFPYFHSSQASSGYNFSGLKKLSVDILLEELKSNIRDRKKIEQLKSKVLEHLQEEQIMKTLYTPVGVNLVDKNINNYKPISHSPNNSLRIDALSQVYVNQKKIIDFDTKSLGGFFAYLIDIL